MPETRGEETYLGEKDLESQFREGLTYLEFFIRATYGVYTSMTIMGSIVSIMFAFLPGLRNGAMIVKYMFP